MKIQLSKYAYMSTIKNNAVVKSCIAFIMKNRLKCSVGLGVLAGCFLLRNVVAGAVKNTVVPFIKDIISDKKTYIKALESKCTVDELTSVTLSDNQFDYHAEIEEFFDKHDNDSLGMTQEDYYTCIRDLREDVDVSGRDLCKENLANIKTKYADCKAVVEFIEGKLEPLLMTSIDDSILAVAKYQDNKDIINVLKVHADRCMSSGNRADCDELHSYIYNALDVHAGVTCGLHEKLREKNISFRRRCTIETLILKEKQLQSAMATIMGKLTSSAVKSDLDEVDFGFKKVANTKESKPKTDYSRKSRKLGLKLMFSIPSITVGVAVKYETEKSK